ncbi:hypothetical protein [Deinococcus hopiensis]|uniref:Uncharacterized protein n=1 Tax=Deinococcus hopiensis KR-140 TaxID=695939 RepID=A0A1W1VUR7_9DEIO|nr:hypothetical protein [Deinococcus hopiensis]SMB97013.1 hypothetical protein SAMN00790413_06290 [Deinococcus hopiensis KR-140]
MTPRVRLLIPLALTYLGATSLLVGVWAQFFPRAFYDRFPGFGVWVAGDGPYNEHLVRDVGGLNLSLAVLAWFAWQNPARMDVRIVGWTALMYAVPHFVYHAKHLHTLTTHADELSSLVGLITAAACALILTRSAPR